MALASGDPRRHTDQSANDESRTNRITPGQHRPVPSRRQPDLFGHQPEPRFDGPDIEPSDKIRLTGQLARVAELMADGQWRTLREIANHVGCSEAGASARLRDLRKPRNRSHRVDRRRDAQGVWLYRVAQGGQS